jgi:hypothetical protein
MSIIERPAHHLAAARTGTVGMPGVDGRWQPTRAGIINSWAWAEETLLFADGWLALAGPNGSGKSLTASMLITVLLDADTSQTALSVSGKAAGTLASRHTDRHESEDRTGSWWLEYGLRSAGSGDTRYLTTGLWLRASGGDLQRAFFVTPGRVGPDLTLQRDREPVRIDDLAQQLDVSGGELFTSSAKLRPRALAHMRAVGDEREYRQAIRTRLFAPLDEVQFDALVGVLRSLRSLRTAEAISPKEMRAVLTDALPALDPGRLTIIAESMERIADLENQLQQTRAEASLLDSTDKLYRRYLTGVAQVQAAALTAANTEFDDQARRMREATGSLQTAQARRADLAKGYAAIRTQISELEGRRDAADIVLRDHAGAELPHMEVRADELAREEAAADTRAREAELDSQSAAEQAGQSALAAQGGQLHLAGLTDDLRRDSAVVGADAAVERILSTGRRLAAASADLVAKPDFGQLSATPLAWADARAEDVRKVRAALRGHEQAQQSEQAAAQDRRAAYDEEELRQDAEGTATSQRQEAECRLSRAMSAWAAAARYLSPIPQELTAAEETGDERLDPDRIAAWLAVALSAARSQIDLAGRQSAAATAAALAEAAAEAAGQVRKESEEARMAAEAAAQAYKAAADQGRAETAAAQQEKEQARAAHDESVAAAHADLAGAEQRLAAGIARSRQAARDWNGRVSAWRGGLIHLARGDIELPDPNLVAGGFDSLSPDTVRMAVIRAHAKASVRLERLAADAEQQVLRAEQAGADIAADLTEARRGAPVPAAPPWRPQRQGYGVPLWALVDFAGHLTAATADRLEGALLVAGLLDALVSPDGRLAAGDLTITAAAPAPGHSLADLLRVEQNPAVEAKHVARVLRAIPVDSPASQITGGTLTTGVMTAASPAGYKAAFIGRTARERARLANVAALEETLKTAQGQLEAARNNLRDKQENALAASTERDSLPAADSLLQARAFVTGLRDSVTTAQRQRTERLARAALVLHQALSRIDNAEASRAAALAAEHQSLDYKLQISEEARTRSASATATAAEQDETARRSERARAEAASAQQQADAERAAFPGRQLADVQATRQAEDRASADLNRARGDLVKAAERHELASAAVRAALRLLNGTASLPDSWLLPTDDLTLDHYNDSVGRLSHQVELWAHAAQRTTELLRDADKDAALSARRAALSAQAQAEEEDARLAAARQAAKVAEARELHGTEYTSLAEKRLLIGNELRAANEQAAQLSRQQEQAGRKAAVAVSTLESIEPQRESAEQRRDECVRQMGRLVDERLAVMPEDVPADSVGRPANLTASLTWARRLLPARPAGADRLSALTQSRARALAALENSVHGTSTALARFDRQVILLSIEGTDWRQAVIAEPDSTRGEDLRLTVQALTATAEQLEADLRDDVKQTLKTGLFTELRRDIQVRREAAQELVRQIRSTLGGVRTGVARVGVNVDWAVRADEDARRMVQLISQPPSDEVFGEMYAVLRQRMDESAGEPWEDRVAHTFDYRAWHDWTISVTHSSFGTNAGQERFREVTARANPLESLSTGERRLATMLPLLAAAWSMYSGDAYQGPRLLSIDEIDAAFDDPNLRQVLALLRSWKFDVLATTPTMTPMIKRETGRAMVHQVVAVGQHRVTVPWLWEGRGEPQPLTLELSFQDSGDRP